MAIIAMLVVGVFTPNIIKKVNAATPGLFRGYDSDMINEYSLEEDDGFYSVQGMSIYGDLAFYAKIKEDGPKENTRVRMWVYNLETGKKYEVYNGSSMTKRDFKLGHANCLFVNKNYVYVATDIKEWPISRYNLHINNGKVYLTDRVNFKMPSEINEAAYGIEYAGSMGQFLVRGLRTIYAGNFEGDTFVCDKKYKIGTTVNIEGEEVDIALKKVEEGGCTHQGIYYKDDYLYLPMINNQKMNQSFVIAFPLDSSTPSGSTLEASDDMVVRITSHKGFPDLFEIEAVSCYKGEMYIAVNARKKIDGRLQSYDFLSRVLDFRF